MKTLLNIYLKMIYLLKIPIKQKTLHLRFEVTSFKSKKKNYCIKRKSYYAKGGQTMKAIIILLGLLWTIATEGQILQEPLVSLRIEECIGIHEDGDGSEWLKSHMRKDVRVLNLSSRKVAYRCVFVRCDSSLLDYVQGNNHLVCHGPIGIGVSKYDASAFVTLSSVFINDNYYENDCEEDLVKELALRDCSGSNCEINENAQQHCPSCQGGEFLRIEQRCIGG